MRQSELVYKTYKDWPKDEESKNAGLLIKAGYIEKVSAGIYNILPLGWKVVNKISQIVREELNKIGAQELLLTNLHPKEFWEATGRWESFDALFKTKSRLEKEYALAPTHEEIIFPLMKKIIQSYKDLPKAVYQIHIKFRDELRAKAGILRTREFLMKDLYSFHKDEEDLKRYKELVDQTYLKIFERCGLRAILTKASGGTFSSFSTEFQVPTPAGEDNIFVCYQCNLGYNEEIFSGEKCEKCGSDLEKIKASEVGNTFELSLKFSEAFDLTFLDKDGQRKFVNAGCYGIGITRVFGVIVEVWASEKYLLWPYSVSPFDYHILVLRQEENYLREAENIAKIFEEKGKEVLIDDRREINAGEKLVESDLIGIPVKIILGEKLKDGKIEIVDRIKRKNYEIEKDHLIHFISTHE